LSSIVIRGVDLAIIDRIKFDGTVDGNWLLHKYPGEEFVLGSQLIVGEGQLAVFVKGGRALDFLGPGTHTLSTGNIPILLKLVNLPFGSKTPFTAEIYYINTTLNMNLKWGTESPIQIIDPVYQVRINARANGQYTLRIEDYSLFLTQLVGTRRSGTTILFSEFVPNFRGIILNSIDTILAQYIVEHRVSVLEIRTKQKEIGGLCYEEIKAEFTRFGMNLVNFFVNSINFPDEDMEAINEILQRKAEFNILGDARYATEKQFEVMENFSRNEGVSGMANAGVGLGMGLGMIGQVGQAFSQMTNNTLGQPSPQAPSASQSPGTIACPRCRHENTPDARFCSGCGSAVQAAVAKKVCPNCRTENEEQARFCNQCGTSLGPAVCRQCGKTQSPGARFCNECGTSIGTE